jgi:hypothetical protein
MMLFSEDSTFANFVADAGAIFLFILWFWLFITAASDLFRRQDISGLGEVVCVILLIGAGALRGADPPMTFALAQKWRPQRDSNPCYQRERSDAQSVTVRGYPQNMS